MEIFSDSIVDKFTAVVNNFCTVIYIVNILAFSTDIKTWKREYQRENIADYYADCKHCSEHGKISLCVLHVLEKIHERNACVHAKSAERRSESEPAHDVKFAYHNGLYAVGNRTHKHRNQRSKIFVRGQKVYEFFFADVIDDDAEDDVYN